VRSWIPTGSSTTCPGSKREAAAATLDGKAEGPAALLEELICQRPIETAVTPPRSPANSGLTSFAERETETERAGALPMLTQERG
jgi:hypothetical protein